MKRPELTDLELKLLEEDRKKLEIMNEAYEKYKEYDGLKTQKGRIRIIKKDRALKIYVGPIWRRWWFVLWSPRIGVWINDSNCNLFCERLERKTYFSIFGTSEFENIEPFLKRYLIVRA